MLYLEDYMEMIENLPMEMRDRFTEMREMDLQVQNAMDSLDERLKTFFKKCGTTPNLKQDWKDEQFSQIKEDYQKALEDADEKVQLATTIHDLLERYLRKLDQEVSKFKMELEADSMGITEILEKRSLELDRQASSSNNHRAEKRKYSSILGNHLEKRSNTEKDLASLPTVVPRESNVGSTSRSNSAAPSPGTSMFNSSSTPALSYSLGHVGAGSNAAIAAAASRAIGATLEMQQGRRTSSLKASYEAVTRQSGFTKEFATFAQQNYPGGNDPLPPPPPPKTPRNKKKLTKRLKKEMSQIWCSRKSHGGQRGGGPHSGLGREHVSGGSGSQLPTAGGSGLPPSSRELADHTTSGTVQAAPATSQPTLQVGGDATNAVATPPVEGTTETVSTAETDNSSTSWQYDPNEPRYCTCNDVSYGDMVGCDNNDCPIEWFHYACVGLVEAPKGKWYCPQCAAAIKRRGRK